MATGGVVHRIPPHAVIAIDTNGAGDTHIGSFVAKLAATGDAVVAAHYANVAAALPTTRKGPATAPALDDVERALANTSAGLARHTIHQQRRPQT